MQIVYTKKGLPLSFSPIDAQALDAPMAYAYFFYKGESIGNRMAIDTLGPLEQSVLYAILRLRNDAYGVAIQREIAEQTGKDTSFGAIYTTLERLENKGFATSRMGEATAVRGGRAKKYFAVTGAGQSALHASERAVAALRGNFGTAGT